MKCPKCGSENLVVRDTFRYCLSCGYRWEETAEKRFEERKEGFYDEVLGFCRYDKNSFYLTNDLYGGYKYECERGWGSTDYVPADKVLELAEKVGVETVSLAGGVWEKVGRKGWGEKVTVEEAKELVKKLRGGATVKSEEEIVSEMCDLLTADSGACAVLEAVLFSAKSTLPAGSPRRVFIQDLAAALNRRDMLHSRDVGKFCELGYKYMEQKP